MPKKPVKIGIEIWLAVDVETKYTLNAIPCLGTDETRAPWTGFLTGLSQIFGTLPWIAKKC